MNLWYWKLPCMLLSVEPVTRKEIHSHMGRDALEEFSYLMWKREQAPWIRPRRARVIANRKFYLRFR